MKRRGTLKGLEGERRRKSVYAACRRPTLNAFFLCQTGLKWYEINQFNKFRKLLTTLVFAIWTDSLITSELVHSVSDGVWRYSHSLGLRLVLVVDCIQNQLWTRGMRATPNSTGKEWTNSLVIKPLAQMAKVKAMSSFLNLSNWFIPLIGRFGYTSFTTYTDRSCADVISRCVVLFPAYFYPSFSNVQYVWKPLYTYGDNV